MNGNSIAEQYAFFPALNASLNATSAVLLLTGRILIARRRVAAHRACMIAAVVSSALFLTCYVYFHFFLHFHFQVRNVLFLGQGWARPVYFAILISHVILAIVIVPLAIITLSRGLKARYPQHRAIAKWTWPLWMYVSVTGVIVYFMLYQWFPHS